ncbi:LysR substrate-binding domain-containing protein [Pendulispora rubella]|uniref:LysR substrate-binding domain-containing protein n=1 Tax=Pendulispora rubella TaxID=2741070 RepID=A0ABZ2KTE6_9BACT
MDLLEKMGTFVRVVDAGSLSAAAKQLHISAAAVSRQVATLEAAIGTPLLLRTTRKMTITDAGRAYYERCVRILRDVESAQSIGRAEGVAGLLTVSAPVSFGLACVVPLMGALMHEHPELHIDLRLEDRFVDLIADAVDVALRVGREPPSSTGFMAHTLVSYERVLVASPAYLKKRGEPKTPEALGKHDALSHPAGNAQDGWILWRDGGEVRARPNVVFRCNAPFAIRQLALEGIGIAQLPHWLVMDDFRQRTLRRVLPQWLCGKVTATALHRAEHRKNPRVRALVDHLRRAFANQTPK